MKRCTRLPLSLHRRPAREVNGRDRVERVILENGAIRTLDPRCRWRGRSRSPASGRGRRRHARDRAREPRGRRPRRALRRSRGSPTPTSTSRPGRSRSGRSGSRLPTLDDALARLRAGVGAARPDAGSARNGWRSGDWRRRSSQRGDLDAVTTTPGRPDLEGLPLALAELGGARARGRRAARRVPAASSSATSAASPPASSARSRPGGSRSDYLESPTTSTWRRCARA